MNIITLCLGETLDLSKTDWKIWLPLLIFFLGYFFTWRKSQLDKRKEIILYRNLFISWIKLAKDRTIKQRKDCLAFSEALKKSEFIQPGRFISYSLRFDKLNQINPEKAINSFVFNITGNEEENLKFYNSLVGNINFLTTIEAELKSKYEHLTEDALEISEMFNKSLLQLEKQFFEKVYEVNDNKEHKDFETVKKINEFRTKWEDLIVDEALGSTANNTFDNLIEPCLKWIKDTFNMDKGNRFLLDFYDELSNMLIIKRRWTAYKEGYGQIFNDYGNQIESSYGDLEVAIGHYLSKTQVYSFWKIK